MATRKKKGSRRKVERIPGSKVRSKIITYEDDEGGSSGAWVLGSSRVKMPSDVEPKFVMGKKFEEQPLVKRAVRNIREAIAAFDLAPSIMPRAEYEEMMRLMIRSERAGLEQQGWKPKQIERIMELVFNKKYKA